MPVGNPCMGLPMSASVAEKAGAIPILAGLFEVEWPSPRHRETPRVQSRRLGGAACHGRHSRTAC